MAFMKLVERTARETDTSAAEDKTHALIFREQGDPSAVVPPGMGYGSLTLYMTKAEAEAHMLGGVYDVAVTPVSE